MLLLPSLSLASYKSEPRFIEGSGRRTEMKSVSMDLEQAARNLCVLLFLPVGSTDSRYKRFLLFLVQQGRGARQFCGLRRGLTLGTVSVDRRGCFDALRLRAYV